jgi:hypothetical protein
MNQMSATRASQVRIQRIAESEVRKSADPARHKCFVSYHVADDQEVAQFITDYGRLFIPTVVGVTEDDDFVDSTDTAYIMNEIRERYLSDSTVTIVMVGRCTWARRFVDWEIYSTLRTYKNYPISGLMGITLPSVANDLTKQAPARLADNVDDHKKYARWWKYPNSAQDVKTCIEDAFQARSNRTDLINNTRARKERSSQCS